MPDSLSLHRLVGLAMDKAGSPEMEELRERFAAFDLCADKRAAAIFGYLLAKEEFQKEDISDSTYACVCRVLENYASHPEDVERSADSIFTIIFQWLCTFPDLPIDRLAEVFATSMPPIDN